MSSGVAIIAVGGWLLAVYLLRKLISERRAHVLADLAPANIEQSHDLPVDSILDSLTLGVVVLDASGDEQFRNAAARNTSVARHEVVLIDAVIERLSKSATAGNHVTEQLELVGPPVRVLIISAIPATNTGAVVTIEDITERWRLDQVRTDFVANVSHELKTPVGAISVLAEILEDESEDETVKTLVRRMVMESHRMARTIDELLELSRIELGGETSFTQVDLNSVVVEAIERSRALALKNRVSLIFNPSDVDCTVEGDRFQLLSAVGNLVDNAIKYSDDESEVSVVVHPASENVVIEVMDHGVGIPVASLDRIFERFYRVDRARSRDTGGTGLGLSIVRHVVTNHGGEVNVKSREGEGSTFSLSLPRRHSVENATMVMNERADNHE